MKRIAYIAPIDYLSGKLSENQSIVYNADGATAWEAGAGVHSAIGYRPRLVAVQRPSSDKRYFFVRAAATVNNSATQLLNLAAMGGTGAIFASILRQKTLQPYNNIYNAYASERRKISLRKWCSRIIRAALIAKSAVITFADGVTINNPWQSQSQTVGAEIPASVITKFNAQLT